MPAIQNLLMTGQPGWELTAPGASTTYSPILDTEAAEEQVLTLIVEALVGAPSAASLGIVFEALQQTTGTVGTSTKVTDNSPIYFDITDSNLIVPAATYSDPLVSEADSFPKAFMWQIKGGFRWRIGLVQAFTGGTAPAWTMSASLVTRY